MSQDLWMAFIAATVVLLIIPGPTVMLILSYALSQGKRVALACALGVATGDFIAMTASLLGLGALVMASAALFSVLKWIGAAYLIWMGIGLLRSAPKVAAQSPENPLPLDDIPAWRVFTHAAGMTTLNPKTLAFFIAFVPQFINPGASVAPQFAILIATFVTLSVINALTLALLAAHFRQIVARPRILAGLTGAGGIALIGMGALTATLRRAA